jgi:ribA/ribD-fused uncharacterized protein
MTDGDAADRIDRFHGEYSFLSNFYASEIEYKNRTYATVEHAYQAAKATTARDRSKIASAKTPGQAKRLGQKVRMRLDWDGVKREIMTELVRIKFTTNPYLQEKLLATESAHLEEGNTWGDVIWGTVNGIGKNWLGEILMLVRHELREQKAAVDELSQLGQEMEQESCKHSVEWTRGASGVDSFGYCTKCGKKFT